MKKIVFVLLVCLSLTGLMISTAVAAENGIHYVSGIEGIKCGTLPGPGTYYKMYNAFYQADTFKRKNGDTETDLDFDLTVFANVHRFVWITESPKTKGNFALGAIVPLQYTDISVDVLPAPPGMYDVDENTFAVGDPYAEFIFSWNGARYDSALGVGLFIPIGKYDQDDPSTPGEDMWTCMLNFSGTYYFDQKKTWSASILGRHEIHTEKSDTNIKPGQNFHFEWGVGKTLGRIWDVGAIGYCQWQVTDDSGSGVDPAKKNDRAQVYAVGPEVSVFLPPYKLQISLRSLVEFDAEDRQEGNITSLVFTKIF